MIHFMCANLKATVKRTNLILDEALLKEAQRILGADTYSATVNTALEQAVKLARIRGLEALFGSGAWSGDLDSMRQDTPQKRPRRKRA